MALRCGATADDFIGLVHVSPAMAEALKLAAPSFTKDVSPEHVELLRARMEVTRS